MVGVPSKEIGSWRSTGSTTRWPRAASRVDDAALVYRNDKGKVKIHQTHDATGEAGRVPRRRRRPAGRLFAAPRRRGDRRRRGRRRPDRKGAGQRRERQAHEADRQLIEGSEAALFILATTRSSRTLAAVIEELIAGGADIDYEVIPPEAQAFLLEASSWAPSTHECVAAPPALLLMPGDAADDHHHPPPGDRPRLPAAQAPGPVQTFELTLRPGARLLSRGGRRALHGGAAARRRPGGAGARRAAPGEPAPLDQYVNDRPYVASSFLSVAIAQVFGTALAGRVRGAAGAGRRADPARGAGSTSLPCRGGEALPAAAVRAARLRGRGRRRSRSTSTFPEWGDEPLLHASTLAATCRLRDLLTHLYVLIPVLDDDKHYWVGDDEVEKLLRQGEGWLAAHPEREVIARRYLQAPARPGRARRWPGW